MELARGRRSPFTQIGDWVFLSTASRNAKLLYWILAAHVNTQRQDGTVWPSRATLAALMGYTKTESIDPFIKELVTLGAIDVEHRVKDNGSKDTNVYVVHETHPSGYAGMIGLSEYYAGRTPKSGGTPETGGRVPPNSGGGVPPKNGYELEVLELDELNEIKTSPSPAIAVEDLFEDFYAAYPKKVNKLAARKAWDAALKKNKDLTQEELVRASGLFAAYEKERGTERRFIKGPDVWLNKGCWLDELTPERVRKSAGYEGPYQNPTDDSVYDVSLADVLRARAAAN
jgi:hypothetical protein